MLVLSRKANERILIGPDITVTVIRFQHGKVSLGIDAPSGVKILRTELADNPDFNPSPDAGKASYNEQPTATHI